MKSKKFILILLLIFIIVLGCVYFVIFNSEKENIDESIDEYQDYVPQQEISEEQYRETIVNLYFLNKDTKQLIAEATPIDAKSLAENPYKELINLLIKGTDSEKLENIIPEGTVLYDASIEGGTVIINISKEFLNFGDDETLKNNIINSIAKTLCELTEVKNISFLIEGEDNEKLDSVYGVI